MYLKRVEINLQLYKGWMTGLQMTCRVSRVNGVVRIAKSTTIFNTFIQMDEFQSCLSQVSTYQLLTILGNISVSLLIYSLNNLCL